jgi:hypothetical protein
MSSQGEPHEQASESAAKKESEKEERLKAQQAIEQKRRAEEERLKKEKAEREAREREQQEKRERLAQEAKELENRWERLSTSTPPPTMIDPETTFGRDLPGDSVSAPLAVKTKLAMSSPPANEKLRISIAHHKLLSKRYSSVVLVHIYLAGREWM